MHPILIILTVIVSTMVTAAAQAAPVTIVKGPVSGHIHPSICRTQEGTLVVFCMSGNSLNHL